MLNLHDTSAAVSPETQVIKVLAARTPEEVIADHEAQELDNLWRLVANVARHLPAAKVSAWVEHRVQRSPSAGTCRVIQYAAELDGRTVRADTLDRLRCVVVTAARDTATARKLEQERGEWDRNNCGDRFAD